MISKTHKKVCTTLNYIEHFPVLASIITGHAFFSLVDIPIRITSSAIRFCAITAGIKKYKKKEKKRKKHDKKVLVVKSNRIKVLI